MRNHFEIWCEELGVPESDPETVVMGNTGSRTRPSPLMVQTWVA